ncbi:hypothetical protein PRIPAC_92926 [Pristionchus pacificus]|uniref:Uncharacterized protein n=1 Tax=Pristionchus pacificus TaxID=54126 RepID=A0A2A6CIN7_PRIPA|nr:hypothetical protein PRIPAC_92926 [Pristionchus pacificus]|eukprot:PDM77881.1 hypothetical protein PRIPAC_34748 [Pristionchus pacificus]
MARIIFVEIRGVPDNESSGAEEAPHDCCIGQVSSIGIKFHSPDAPVPSFEEERDDFEQLLDKPLCQLVPLSPDDVPNDDISGVHAIPLLCRTSASRISSFNGEREDVERVLSDDDFSAPSNALEEPWYDAWDDADGEEIPVAMPPITEGYGAEFVYDEPMQVVQLREEIVESSRRARRRTLSEMSYDETGNWKKCNDESSSEDELDNAQEDERSNNYDADEEDCVDEMDNRRSSGGKRRPPGAPEYEDEAVVKRRRLGLDE